MEIQKKYKLAYKKIKQAKNILLITHERPDGDALSSICAISLLLDDINKKYRIYCADKPSPLFDFLPNIEKISDEEPSDWSIYDLIVVLDCGSASRTKAENELLSPRPDRYLIEIDHHPAMDKYANLEIRHPGLSSTAEMIYRLFKANDLAFDKDKATCILTGILTDTINFLNPTTTSETISAASEMLSRGARMPKINKFTWKNKNIRSMKILGNILNSLKVNPRYNFAFACLTLEEMKKIKGEEQTFDSIINFLSNVDDVKGVMLLREEESGKIKGSLRTNHPKIDISKLAKLLNGGGHPKASGFKINGHIKKTANSWRIVDG